MKIIAKTTVKAYNKSMTPIISEVKIMKGKTKVKKLTCLSHARSIIQKTMKQKGWTSEDMIKSFDEVRNNDK